jgi:hypothetical protein
LLVGGEPEVKTLREARVEEDLKGEEGEGRREKGEGGSGEGAGRDGFCWEPEVEALRRVEENLNRELG